MMKKGLYLVILMCFFFVGCKSKEKTNIVNEEITVTPTETLSSTEVTDAPSSNEVTVTPTPVQVSGYGEMRGLTPMELISEMTTGWNLGNTFDAKGAETFWGNPVTTKEMIDQVAEAGFDIIRIPITWYIFTGDAPDYKIDETRLNRIKEVIDYALDNGMYVIMNMHHEDWLLPQAEGYDVVEDQFIKMWVQIAQYYMNYGDHLLFEGINEPRIEGGKDEWNGGTEEGRDALNKLNEAFVRTVRATGGNNEKRCLLITTFAAQPSVAGVNGLVVPEDNNLIVSIHAYTPYRFTYYNDTDWDLKVWDGSANSEIDGVFDLLDKNFIQKGIPVMITEYGAVSKEVKLADQSIIKNEDQIAQWVSYYIKKANQYGIKCIWWDNGYHISGNELFGIFNRKELTWYQPKVVESIMAAAKADPDEVEEPMKSTGFLDEKNRAKAVYGTPVIDGIQDEVWDTAGVIHPGIITGTGVLASAEVRLLWDENYLYTLFVVKDTVLNKDSANDWEQDSVEIFLDELNDKTTTYQADDLQFRVRFDNYASYPSGDKNRLTSAVSGLFNDDNEVIGYIVETALAWSVEATSDSVKGFDLQINDASAYGTRSGTINIFDTTGTAWSDPSTMGELILIR